MRTLVVEDEMTIALLIEDMLDELGFEVVGLAMRLPQAVEMAKTSDVEFAILDVNLDGRMSFEVAEVLAARAVPFLFATGYGALGLETRFADRPVLKKPFSLADLRGAIANAASEPTG